MTPMCKRWLDLAGILAALFLLVVLGGATAVAVGPARALPDPLPNPHSETVWGASAHQPAAVPGTIVAVAGYNGVPGTGILSHSPAGGVPAHVLYVPWTDLDSTLFIQNTESSNSAALVASFYDLTGSLVATHVDSIPAAGSLELPLASLPTLPSGYEGGAVLESDWPIAAVVNVQPSASDSLLSYNASQAPDPTVVLPEIMKDTYGWDTSFWVQNAGAVPANVTMAYYAYGSGLVFSGADTIPPGTSHVYRQVSMPGLGTNFYGLVLIQATEPVVAVAEARNSLNPAAFAYSGIAQSSTDAYLLSPRQQKAADGWSSGISFVNPGASLADVSANWYPGDGSTSWNQMGSVPPQDGLFFNTVVVPGMPDGFDGSLIAEATQPLASLNHWMNSSLAGDGHGINPAIGLSTLGSSTYLPRVAHSMSTGTITEFSIQDPGLVAADVTITFYDQSGSVSATVNDTIPALGVHRYATGDVSALGDEWEGSVIVESTQPVAVEVMQYMVGVGTCPVVSDPADSGPSTLRDCLERAAAGDTITFDPAVFPPGSPVSITVASDLPSITQGNLTIDASGAGVILDGSSVIPNLGEGLYLISDGNAVVGLQIFNFPGDGIEIYGGSNNTIANNVVSGNSLSGVNIAGSGATGNRVVGNRVGTDASGTTAVGGHPHCGVRIGGGARYNTIGGDTEDERNLISGNDDDGVCINDSGTMSNTVSGNYIGTDISGTTAIPNAFGVSISAGAQYNMVGGSNHTPGGACTGECNLLSGNDTGMLLVRSGTNHNVISGNYIGTDRTGTFAVPNGGGIWIVDEAQHNVIGGTTPGERNVISGNSDPIGGPGIWIEGPSTDYNVVIGNHIGTDASGLAAIPNGGGGVAISDGAGHSTVGGSTPEERNLISGNSRGAVGISGAHNTVIGNYIGVDVTGLVALGNEGGVGIEGTYNRVGGTTSGERNIISGNGAGAVYIENSGTMSNTVLGNYIGTDIHGTTAIPNGWGVQIWSGAQRNIVGGSAPGEGNLISGNSGDGIIIQDNETFTNTVSGNYIGTTANGTAALANYGYGIHIHSAASYNGIGGDAPGQGNLISGNTSGGVGIGNGDSNYNLVSGNYIGTDASGTAAIPNGGDGVSLWWNASWNTVGISNTIAFNAGHGVSVDSGGTLYNTITRNSVHSNTNQGIALSDGGNGGLSAPAVATFDPGSGTASGTALPGCTVEVYSDAGDEGRWFEGEIVADGGGNWAFSKGSAFVGPYVQATCTDTSGNTSEFSPGIPDTCPVVSDPADSGPSTLRDCLERATAGDTITFDPAVFPPGSPVSITLVSGLPAITQANLTIDGSAAGVIVDGSAAGLGVDGLVITSDGNAIKGLQILNFSGNGITIDDGANNTIGGSNTTPGTGCSGDCNVISGNQANGLAISGSGATGNTVGGNLVGLDVSGTDALGNGSHGITILVGAQNNVIGGATPEKRNVIASNGASGVRIDHPGTAGNIVKGNYVGTDISGTMARGNTHPGVSIAFGATENQVGGAAPGEGNLISGNNHNGVQISDSDTISNTVIGNYIGTDAAGTGALPNTGFGVFISGNASHNVIGGPSEAERNVITYNQLGGVTLTFGGTDGNIIQGNWIGVDVDGTRQAAVALIAFSPAYVSDRTIIVGTEGQGVFKTTDGGQHWTEANTGLTDLDIDALAISPNYDTDQTIFAGTEAGLFKSTDGGASWLRVSPEKGGNYILSVALSPDYGNDQTVLVGTSLQWDADERTWLGGVWKSSDGGATWANLAPASGLSQASNPATMGLRGGNLPNVGELWSRESGLGLAPLGQDLPPWIDEQEGMSLQQDEGFIVGYAVAFSPDYATDQTMFVGAHWYEGSLYKSADGGETWSRMNAGLEGSSTRQIAISPDYGNDQTLYVMDTHEDGARPFRSTDGGTNWTELTTGLPGDDSLALGFALSPEFATDDVVFASFCYPGGDPRGFFRSDDRGDSWVEASPGIQQPGRFGVIAASPNYAVDGQLLLSAERNGLLLSVDEGNTWAYANGDLTDPGNGGSGISIMGGSRDNVIGGDSPGARNLISKNGAEGVVLEGPGTSGNIVTGNYIGTDASGTASLGNSGSGVDIRWGALQNRVGGENDSPGGGCSGACNLISGNGGVGIRIGDDTSEHNLVSGNYIGTTYSGTDALGNNSHGVQIMDGASNNTIGGVTPAERNLISGNMSDGIEINGGPDGNIISGNYIGTDASGTIPIGNGYYGINIYSGYNLVGGENATPGGPCSGECNLISGNVYGLQIVGYGAISNTVTGNYIGTDVNGTTAIPALGRDSSDNLQIDGAHNRVGGATPAERNVIAGPIDIAPPYMEPTHNQFIGNYIGVDATGTTCIANGYLGISVWGSDHVIGGDTPAEGNWICGYDLGGISVSGTDNIIAYNKIFDTLEEGIWIGGSGNLVAYNEIYENSTEGVRIEGETALTNTLTHNSIYDNGLLGIDLVDGGNTELPAPVVLGYDVAAGTANGTACALCTIEISSDDGDEGRWYEGTETADALGDWAFSKGAPFSGANVHATATDAEGNTSEFSRSMHDIAVVGASPSGEVPVGQASGVHAQLLNEGSQPESNVPVRCAIQNTSYDETATSGEMQPATWAMVEFPAWTPPAAGVYTLTCQSMLPGDENRDNDVYTQVVTATLAGLPDVWTKDNDEDSGDVPSDHPWWVSPDIWVRHQDDHGLVHQNPIAFQDNTVYVQLRNRGSRATSGQVQIFWDRSRIGWPCKVGQPNVGTIPFEDLAPGEVRIVSLQWEPQEVGHHGLHTVIQAEGDPADWSAPCSPHLPRWDNNVSWHNVIVYMHPPAGDQRVLSVEKVEVDLVNVYDWLKDMDLIVERGSFPATGVISLRLDEELFDRWWSYAGRWTEDVQVDEATKVITISGEISATIGGLPLKAKEEVTATLAFDAPGEGMYEAEIHERIDDVVIGGMSYQWIDSDDTPPAVQTTSPLSEAVEIALDAPIVVTFTEEIGPLSLNLALEPDPGGWHLAWNEGGTVFTATHTHSRFEPETTYTATVTAGDAFANAMEEPYAWTFATREGYWIYLPLLLRNH